MSMLSFVLNNRFKAPEEFIPRYRLDRVAQSRNQRLGDIVQQGFEHACMLGDVETAQDLLNVLENQRSRWIEAHGVERRDGAPAIARMKEMLLLKAADATRPIPLMHMQRHTPAPHSGLNVTQQAG